jgi:hypothetical protein
MYLPAARIFAWGPTTGLKMIAPSGGRRIYALRRSGRLVRLLANGRSDPRFGDSGALRLPLGFAAQAFLVHANSVYVLGAEGRHMAAFRIDRDGRPVTGFGHAGLAILGGPVHGTAIAAAVDPRGRLLLLGARGQGPPAVARLRSDGRPDRSFGNSGLTARMPLHVARGGKIAALPDERVAIATSSPAREQIRGLRTTLVRLNRRGRVVRSFGRAGAVGLPGFVTPLTVFASGSRILVGTAALPVGFSGFSLRAFRTNGQIDPNFGHDGVVREASTSTLHFGALVAEHTRDGGLIVVGTARHRASTAQPELLRLR